TDVPEVVRHLVDEERGGYSRLAAPVDSCRGQVLCCESGEFLGTEIGKDPRGTWIAILGGKAAQSAHDLLYVGKLLGALHLRVGCEDLLEQGGPRAGQADDENGIRGLMSPTGATGEEFGRTDPDLLPGVGLDQLRAIAALGPLELVALLVVAVRLGKI